jgi:hypothetical protein
MVRCLSPSFTKTTFSEANICVQEHTWYEDYPLSFEDRPHILERHNPKGKPTKQTFYIVRFLHCSLSPLRSSTDSFLPCRTTPLVSNSLSSTSPPSLSSPSHPRQVSSSSLTFSSSPASPFSLRYLPRLQEVLSPNSALFTYLQADSWDEHSASHSSLPSLLSPILTFSPS